MRKLMKMGGLALIASVMFTACSIEKRHYMPGYHVEWKTKTNTTSTATANEETTTTTLRKQTAPTTVEKHDVANAQTGTNPEVTPVTNSENGTTALAPSTSAQTFSPSAITTTETKASEGKIRNAIIKHAVKKQQRKPNHPNEPSKGLLIFLAIFIPWLAVGLATDWGMEVLWNILWSLTCIGGIIHAIIIVNREM